MNKVELDKLLAALDVPQLIALAELILDELEQRFMQEAK